MMLANKHFTPILGIDIHIVIIPPGVPTPIPHPFIGMVMDPMDYIPYIGSTTNVNAVPRGNSGVSGVLGTYFHIPMGGPFAMAPLIGHDSLNFFGSNRVAVDGNYFSAAGFMLMTCNDLGLPLIITPGKKPKKPNLSRYLPTSATLPMGGGKPVMVGGPYVPDVMGMLMQMAVGFGFGKLMKKGGKMLNKALKKFPATKGLQKKLCKMGFEPVDLVTGRMVYDGEDFSIPGIIPVRWERNWYSDSDYSGLMGHGFHCNYDVALHIEASDDAIVMRLPDGRVMAFPYLIAEGNSYYDRSEKMTLTCIDSHTYTVEDHNENLIYTFKKKTDTLFKPSRLSNEDGFKVTFVHNAAHVLERIIDTAGRLIDIATDSQGRATKITATHEGNVRELISYRYNDEGDLTHIIDALGQPTVMEYENHLMVKKTDRNGQAFYWKYDGKTTGAKCIRTWGDDGILAGHIDYRKGHNIVTNSLGAETIYYFNSLHLCTQVTDAEGGHIFHEYTDFMEPYRDINQEGNVTGYTYNARGNLTGIHQPDGSIITFAYDDKDRLILTQDPIGGATIRAYKNERLHATIAPDGGVTSFTYNEKGLINTVHDNANNVTNLLYDSDHNLKEMELPNGASSTWVYDAWGRCVQTTNPEKHKQQFFYDELDRIQKIQQADKNTIKLKYNAYDEVIETVDSKRHKIHFDYTPLGSLKLREENGAKVHFKYNTEEELVAINNEHEEFYYFGRNAKGEIINETGFDGLRRDYFRDRAGKVLKVQRPEERFTEYEYDLNGKITRAEYYDGTWETYSYDRAGNLIEARNQNTHVILERDNAGRIIKETQDGHTVESQYDKLSNRTKVTSSLDASINIDRNKFGFINGVSASATSTNNSLLSASDEPILDKGMQGDAKTKDGLWTASFKHNSIGQEVERSLPGGIVSKMEYDHAGRPIAQKVSRQNRELRNRSYTWDANDQLRKMVNEISGGKVNYGHDEFGNLAWAQYEDKQMDYKLPDEVGNLYRSKGQKDRKYGKGGQLLEADGNKFKYDLEGNLIKKITPKGNWKYEWFGNGMLRSVITSEGKKVEFEYDALGRRTAKIKPTHKGGKITRFVWDGNTPLHEWKYNLNDRPQLVVNEDGVLENDRPEPLDKLVTWVFDEGTFKPAAKIIDGHSYSIVTDYLGTPVEMYNEAGEKTWEVEYDIYGKVRTLAKGSLNDCPFRYQGQYEDEETGLYYNRFRYYSADEGVYLSQDPIGLAGGMPTLYSYVKDINFYVDKFGLSDCSVKVGHKIGPRSTVKRIKLGTNGKSIVIGRNMGDRVIPSAKNIDADYWKGFDETLPDELNLANNKKWLEDKILEGNTVIDIGLDPKYVNLGGPGSKTKGAFYSMETQIAFGKKW
ncbi:DUF6531 domain-containing protein [Cochleicola gelatinilyticus]|uniref:Type IV secretion protein Rhs n=1 Tax=Cochleicola gelatinilyticus TaxID=1763537 RepID=A0A167HL88_9FLAO|nr:DUF6531 domain-containing protein [Cochleicola gelatinilyticus]OAB78731.1 hypothetical protein ULVI_09115 [Cochleicola gelatinilyticus]